MNLGAIQILAPVFVRQISSPIGPLTLVATDSALIRLEWGVARSMIPRQSHSVLDRASHQLDEYFRGDRTEFSIPLAPAGTVFQRRVWDELSQIPYGETVSYGEVACRIGRPNAARAVGAANRLNPIGIIIPCHRVIGKSGDLVGFAGGLNIKSALLTHESARRTNGSTASAHPPHSAA